MKKHMHWKVRKKDITWFVGDYSLDRRYVTKMARKAWKVDINCYPANFYKLDNNVYWDSMQQLTIREPS